MTTCDYCGSDVAKTYRVEDDRGVAEQLCEDCRDDVRYAASKGRIPQHPADGPWIQYREEA